MLIDYLFFWRFLKLQITKSVFIIAAPRSATTYLFHKLANQKEKTTSFKLWELIFAPSITQKYLLIFINKLDTFFGKPIRSVVLWMEHKLFGKFKDIHKIGLNLPEEDEAILLWNMSTIYLNFFFPETEHFEDYFLFDEKLSQKKQKRIMRYYYRCVQRHCFVFNRDGKKIFLSKNPAMMSKVKSLHAFFPEAIILNINRCPSNVIPSTLALNDSIYHFFTSINSSNSVHERTKNILINWFKMAHENLNKYYRDTLIEIDFTKLISGSQEIMTEICARLDIDKSAMMLNEEKVNQNQQSKNHYSLLNTNELAEILEKLPFMKKYCNSKSELFNHSVK